MSGFSAAVLLVLVGLSELAVPPALPTHKLHFKIRRPELLQDGLQLLREHNTQENPGETPNMFHFTGFKTA